MRILFITDNFPPEVNAPASRTFEHSREWVKAGHDVTVITCFPNFPTGKVYPGYTNRLGSVEQMDGIQVWRVWSYITANEGFMKRILDYMSFMLSATILSLKTGKYDLIIGTSPQFFSAVAAYTISSLKSRPFIFELRDIWPESIRAVGAMKESRVLDIFEKLELYLYKKSAHVISVTKSFKQNLINRGVPSAKISVVENGVDLKRYYPRPKDASLVKRYDLNGQFVAGYIGTHGMAHALETLLEAAKIIQDHGFDGSEDIRFVLLGSGARKLQLIERASELGLKNMLFLDSVSKEEVANHWSLLDVSIIHLRKTALFRTVIPSKIFESMAMGIPVLLGVQGESAEILTENHSGVLFEPENPFDLVEKIRLLKDDVNLRETCRASALSAVKTFDRRQLARKMLHLVQADI